MALSEFVAMEAAYRALQPLDAAARGRALHWLTDALGIAEPLPESGGTGAVGVATVRATASVNAAPGAGSETPEPPTGPVAVGAVIQSDEQSDDQSDEQQSDPAEQSVEAAESETSPKSATVSAAKTAAKTAKTGSRGRASRRPLAGGAKGRRGKSAKAAAEASDERVYRRMPPPEEVLAAYRQVGTVSGLAGFFNVPRYTVQGWARRLRGAGYEIGRKA